LCPRGNQPTFRPGPGKGGPPPGFYPKCPELESSTQPGPPPGVCPPPWGSQNPNPWPWASQTGTTPRAQREKPRKPPAALFPPKPKGLNWSPPRLFPYPLGFPRTPGFALAPPVPAKTLIPQGRLPKCPVMPFSAGLDDRLSRAFYEADGRIGKPCRPSLPPHRPARHRGGRAPAPAAALALRRPSLPLHHSSNRSSITWTWKRPTPSRWYCSAMRCSGVLSLGCPVGHRPIERNSS